MSRHPLRLLALATIVLLAPLVVAVPRASAQQAQTFEADPALAAGVDGPVWASTLIANQLWVGGEFSSARNYAFDSPTVTTGDLAVIDINTGNLFADRTFTTNGRVYALTSDAASSTVWAGGVFTLVNGVPRSNVVAFDAVTGEVRQTFVGDANNQVRDVLFHDGWLYIAGNMNNYNGQGASSVIRVNPVTGARDANFETNKSIWVEALDASGDLLAVAERPTRDNLIGETELWRISTGLRIDGLDTQFGEGVWDATFSPDGSRVYNASVDNTIQAFTTNDVLQWQSREADGDMQAVAATDQWVIAGFHEGFRGNTNRRIVAFSPSTGTEITSWYVEMNSYWGVRGLEVTNQGLVAVGEFSNVNGFNSRRVAIFRPNGGWSPADPLVPAVLAGDVDCSDALSLLDARAAAQMAIGSRVGVASCPVGANEGNSVAADADGNGAVTLLDARLIAQCAIGTANVLCPA